ncbi:MAG: hypothetical protein RLZZ272_1719 [Actinomycetota bacterium]|jgi:holo-[acyl-carrier protein] synthase
MSAPDPVVGCDVVAVDRIARLVARGSGSASRVFSETELADATRGGVGLDSQVAAERLAARFAAKEATRKALGGRGPGLAAIEVRTAEDGGPSIIVAGLPTSFACSLSHDGGVAMAVVLGPRAEAERLLGALGWRDGDGDEDRARIEDGGDATDAGSDGGG